MTDVGETTQLPGLDSLLGVHVVESSGSKVVLTWAVRPELLQPFGILHGGVHCAVVESAASMGAANWYGDRGTVVGVANHTNFLRAVSDGQLTATAEPIHQGGMQQLWLVSITDEAGRLIARGEVRLQNLPHRD